MEKDYLGENRYLDEAEQGRRALEIVRTHLNGLRIVDAQNVLATAGKLVNMGAVLHTGADAFKISVLAVEGPES